MPHGAAVPEVALGEPTAELRAWSGQPLPGFVLPDLTGVRHALIDGVGRPVLVHFFATWCEPCRPELQSLERLAARAPDRLRILAISVGEPDGRVRRFFEQLPVSFPVLLDRDRAVAKGWGVDIIPTSFLLDATLNPRLFVERDLEWDRLDLTRILEALSARAPVRGVTTGDAASMRRKTP